MPSPKRLLLQIVNYSIFMALIWYFSFSPSYVRLTPDQSMITLALSHAGKPVEECRRKSPEELAKLAPNMRVLEECPRERSPVQYWISPSHLLYASIYSGVWTSGHSCS